MLMSVRDMDVLRLLCWCQNVRPDDLSSISTETERENLITLGLIKRHQRSDTLLLTNSGRAFLQAALEGDVPNLTLSYHDAAIERRVRLSSLMMTAYHAGINVFTITANSLAEPSTLFITAITRSRGHNPWGSARVGAIAHLGSTYYAVHYIYSGIGRMAVNDELAAFHNHTNFGKDTQRAFLFAGASYADIIEELKVRDEKRDTKLIQYSEAYSCAPFITEDESEVRGSRTSDLEGLADGKPSAACQEPQNLLSKNREDRASRTAKSAFPEPQKLTPSKKEKRKIDQSHMEVRPSVRATAQDGRTDGDAEEELLDILDGCELECFAPETALVFENAIERLFYADSFRIGNATLPQSRVRAKLRRLDGMILREAESKLRANQERNVKNSTAYTMAVLFNCIAESESDLMIDPYLNAICAAV